MTPNQIRNIRERKRLSQDKVAQAAGISWSQFCRIEAGRGRTTQEEVDHVLATLEKMEPGTRKLAGRPFSDPKLQAAVATARETGLDVGAVIASGGELPKPKRSRNKA